MEKTEDLTLVAYRQSQETKEESTRCLLAAFAYLGIPESLIDLGCGDGHLVQVAGSVDRPTTRGWARCVSYGVDSNVEPFFGPGPYDRWYVERGDLTKPLDLEAIFKRPKVGPFDMALCWEVAEHLPPEAADTLCDTAASVLAPGGHLLWSAARPGQPGAGHINCQPTAYWRNKLTDRGLSYLPGISKTLRNVMGEVASKAWWYGANMCVFKKPESE